MKRFYLLLLALPILTSCKQRSLCYDEEEEGGVYTLKTRFTYDLVWHENYDLYDDYDDINLEWSESELTQEMTEFSAYAKPTAPGGVRIQVLRDGAFYKTANVGAREGTLRLEDGEYSFICYNNDTEAVVINHEFVESDISVATTRTRVRSTYEGNPLIGSRAESTVTEPDMLFAGYVDSFTPDKKNTQEVLEVEMVPVVYSYITHFHFAHGLEYVALARGALEGMAEAVYLTDGSTTDESVTILYDCEITDTGVTAAVKTFGVPGYTPGEGVIDEKGRVTDNGRKYGLTLEVRLTNGTLKTFNFDVTDQMVLQPNGGVITVDGLVIEDKEGRSGGSAFDVKVDSWGEFEDVMMQL
jgi:hypothetical protein